MLSCHRLLCRLDAAAAVAGAGETPASPLTPARAPARNDLSCGNSSKRATTTFASRPVPHYHTHRSSRRYSPPLVPHTSLQPTGSRTTSQHFVPSIWGLPPLRLPLPFCRPKSDPFAPFQSRGHGLVPSRERLAAPLSCRHVACPVAATEIPEWPYLPPRPALPSMIAVCVPAALGRRHQDKVSGQGHEGEAGDAPRIGVGERLAGQRRRRAGAGLETEAGAAARRYLTRRHACGIYRSQPRGRALVRTRHLRTYSPMKFCGVASRRSECGAGKGRHHVSYQGGFARRTAAFGLLLHLRRSERVLVNWCARPSASVMRDGGRDFCLSRFLCDGQGRATWLSE